VYGARSQFAAFQFPACLGMAAAWGLFVFSAHQDKCTAKLNALHAFWWPTSTRSLLQGRHFDVKTVTAGHDRLVNAAGTWSCSLTSVYCQHLERVELFPRPAAPHWPCVLAHDVITNISSSHGDAVFSPAFRRDFSLPSSGWCVPRDGDCALLWNVDIRPHDRAFFCHSCQLQHHSDLFNCREAFPQNADNDGSCMPLRCWRIIVTHVNKTMECVKRNWTFRKNAPKRNRQYKQF
jgi:hypothetical protein